MQQPRRVPEAALATGVLLSTSFVAFVFVLEVTGSDPLAGTGSLTVVGVALAVLYPFAAWAVYHSDDPTWALPPRPVAGVAAAVAAGTVLLGVFVGAPLLGVVVALLAALPPAAYVVVQTRPDVASTPVLAGAAALATLVLALGVARAETLLGGVAALVLVVAAVGYHARVDGRPLDPRQVAGVGAGVAVLVVVAGLLAAAPLVEVVVGVGTAAFLAVLAVYATAQR